MAVKVNKNMVQTVYPFSGINVGAVRTDVLLSGLGSWRIGGPADWLVQPDTPEQLAVLLQRLKQLGLPWVMIGQGTNLLFDDTGLRGAAVQLGPGFARCRIDGDRICAGAALWVPALARCAQKHGLAGFEHIIGIPGSLGGLLVMNGGSNRRAIGEQVETLSLVDFEGRPRQVAAAECDFDYRTSNLAGQGLVFEACLRGTPAAPAAIRRAMLADLRARRRFPRKQPNCGSVFLSSSEMHAEVGPPGLLIEQAGLKGARIGGAMVSPRHANFIVNAGGASCRDVLSLIALVRSEVERRTGYLMACEVRYVAPDGRMMPAHLALDTHQNSGS